MSTKDIHENHEPAPPLGLGSPEREAWVRRWFWERYQAPDVFGDGAEALTLDAAMQLVADAQAAERERWRSAAHCAVTAGYDDLPDALHALGELLRA